MQQPPPSVPTGDPNLPVDPSLALVVGAITFIGAAVSLNTAPVVLALGYFCIVFTQSALFALQADVEQAIMSAWTMHSLLEMNYHVRAATRTGEAMIRKLREDDAALEASATSPDRDFDLANEDRAIQKAVRGKLAWVEQSGFEAMGKTLEAAFDRLRESVITGGIRERRVPPPKKDDKQEGPPAPLVMSYFTPDVIREQWELARQMVAYAKLAQAVEEQLLERVPILFRNKGERVERLVPASARMHARAIVTNESNSLVFFVRTRDRSGVSRGMAETERWITLYPRGAVATVSSPGQPAAMGEGAPAEPKPTVLSMQLPSSTWVPMKLGETLELRVATYGTQRQLIRWKPLRGRFVRPDVHSVSRGFYYVGYELPYVVQTAQTPARHYAVSERYQWQFAGAWERSQPVPTGTPGGEVSPISQKTHPLSITGDRVLWKIPDTAGGIEADPVLSAQVTGGADFELATRTKRERFSEQGSGRISIVLQVW